MPENFRPRPVSVTTPTIRPAPAQVAPTLSTPTEPPSSAFTSLDWPRPRNTPFSLISESESRAVSERRKLVKSDTTVAQKTDRTGEKPHIMNRTIEISDRKWYQYLAASTQTDSTFSKVV